MTPNPILRVLSSLKKHKVKSLLIGGQACIVYGAAEFSRDSDFAILCTPDNLKRLNKALNSLRAALIYVPALEAGYLDRGHACHFRCGANGVEGLRIDVISKMRGCGSFDDLWKRRKRVHLSGRLTIDVIGLEDLVQSKKTQRDKDWLMLRRLVDNDIVQHRNKAQDGRVEWWLMECRSPEFIIELVHKYPKMAKMAARKRPLLLSACAQNTAELESQLYREELVQREKDRAYWAVLRKELESLRHQKPH